MQALARKSYYIVRCTLFRTQYGNALRLIDRYLLIKQGGTGSQLQRGVQVPNSVADPDRWKNLMGVANLRASQYLSPCIQG